MFEQPPDTDATLQRYLQRLIDSLTEKLTAKDVLTKNYTLPTRPIEGKLYFFPNTIAPTITTAGVWVYKSTGWVLLG